MTIHQPCYPVTQEKGLVEELHTSLMSQAVKDGYSAVIDEILFNMVAREITQLCTQPSDLLEIGGGNGKFFERMKNHTRTYINIEPGYIALKGKNLERLSETRYTCIKCSAENIPLPDKSVDVILSIASLDHVPDYQKALSETRRLLRPGGIFILVINNRRSWWKQLLAQTNYLKQREIVISNDHYFQWSFSECQVHLNKFIPVHHMQTTAFMPFIRHLWRPLLPITNAIGQVAFRQYGGYILAVCQKS